MTEELNDIVKLKESHNVLKDLHEMQREIVEEISCGVLAYTLPDYRILSINEEAKRIIGWRDGEVPIEAFRRFLSEKVVPEDRELVSNIRVSKPGDVQQDFYHVKNGEELMSIKASLRMLDFAGGQKHVLCTMFDITEEEQTKRLLDEERRQYRDALAFGSEAFFELDMDEGVLNHHVIAKSGRNITEALGLEVPVTYEQLTDAWLHEDRIVSGSDVLEIIRSRDKVIERCKQGNSIIDFEYHIPSNNRYYHVMALLDCIGGVPRVSFVLTDITSSRQEERLRQNVIKTLGKVYSGVYHFALNTNTYTMVKYYDEIVKKLPVTGKYTDFVRIYSENFVDPESKDKIDEFLSRESIVKCLADTEYASMEYLRKKIGWCRLTLIAADRDENGEVTSVVFAGTVIEAQKQAELAAHEALKAAYESANMANSAKTDFLANMSHDIRTPMNAIIGMTAIAGTHLDDRERVVDCLSKITISSKHLLGIINEILDMSKIESGKMELEEEEFKLSELIDNLLTMSKPSILAKNHSLTVSIHDIEHENVIGDSQRIQQVFINIMSNAIKYTPEGGKIRLAISEKSTNKPKIGCYEFIFEDNGIGMSEETVANLFEPFYRARNDMRIGKIQGTGLGMTITRNIVQMMNGDIKVESRLNGGTKFTITIFLKLEGKDDVIDYGKFVNLSILVADDDEESCLYTCEMLDEIGMKSEWVLTGQEAVERTVKRHENANDFFAVILDWKMPDMDGIETTRQIRKKVGKDVPIIIISAYDWSDIELEARAAGANAFISQPLFKSRMVHMFNKLICGEEKAENGSDLISLAKGDFAGKRALVVEDNGLNAEIAGEILGMAGLDITFAQNGKEAVDIMCAIEDNYFDIVFMDIQMPIMNGYEAARAIRAISRDYLKSVPIIAMTANAFAEDVASAKNAGMNEHIAKPLDFNHLLTALKKWVK